MDTDTIFLFPPFWLDVHNEQLWRNAQALALRPKTFAVLRYLVAHAGQLATQGALLDAVWGPTAVSEAVVRRSIRELRATLGDTVQHPHFIQTVHRRGYRFIAPVTVANTPPVRSPVTEAPWWALPPAFPEPAASASPPREPSLEEEHKLVTILCCAVTDAPALAVHHGPEVMHRLMQAVFARAQEVIQRYEGTITSVTGEGFTALFGAPVAQEDHARRAVLAALELRQELRAQPLGESHAVGMGVHTGPVVVGRLAHTPQQLYTAVGDTMHQASQLQRLATPGTILLTAATRALVQEEVRVAACDALSLSGPRGPLPVYTLQDLTQRRAGVAGQGGRHRSPFVGREREFALLHACLAHVAQGHGQVLGIAGEPGIGKSRLLAEWRRSLAGQPVTYREGHCFPYSSTTPYLPVRDLFRQGCGLTEADGVESRTAKVHRYLEAAHLIPENDAPLLLQLLDVPVDSEQLACFSPQERKVRTFALLRHLVLRDCRHQPLVLAVENLHWIDATSEAWLTALVEHLDGSAILLLVTHRPGYRAPWLAQAVATQMALPRLLPEDSLAVVQSVLQATPLPAPLLRTIITKAGGNPFFLEELAWTVREQGRHPEVLGLPETIQTVLAARLDRLPLAAKQLLQTVAVIGTEVAVPLLQAVAELPPESLDQALQRSHQVLTWAQGVAHAHSLAVALTWVTHLHQARREFQVAQVYAETLQALATERGFPYWLAEGTILRGWALAKQGQVEEGIAQICQGLYAYRATGATLGQPYFLSQLAEAYGRSGRVDAGLEALAEALVLVDKTGERFYEAESYRLTGELLLQTGGRGVASGLDMQRMVRRPPRVTEAETYFSQALAVARRQQAKSWELRGAMSLARLWQQQGQCAQARELLAPIYTWFTEGFDTADLQEAKALLEILA